MVFCGEGRRATESGNSTWGRHSHNADDAPRVGPHHLWEWSLSVVGELSLVQHFSTLGIQSRGILAYFVLSVSFLLGNQSIRDRPYWGDVAESQRLKAALRFGSQSATDISSFLPPGLRYCDGFIMSLMWF